MELYGQTQMGIKVALAAHEVLSSGLWGLVISACQS
jgi:hypothetical protein